MTVRVRLSTPEEGFWLPKAGCRARVHDEDRDGQVYLGAEVTAEGGMTMYKVTLYIAQLGEYISGTCHTHTSSAVLPCRAAQAIRLARFSHALCERDVLPMRMVVAVIATLTTLSPLFAAETIPCIVINGKAYAPAAFLPMPGAVFRERTMAGHSFVRVREYAEAVGGELINEGGLGLRCGELDVAVFSLHQADRYCQSTELQTACPTVWAAARSRIAPHVGTSLRPVPRPKPQRPQSTLSGPSITPLRRPQSAVAVRPQQSELDALRTQLQQLYARFAELNRQIDSFGPLGPPLDQRMPVFDEARRVSNERIRIIERIRQLSQ